jgi:hypothetical protein
MSFLVGHSRPTTNLVIVKATKLPTLSGAVNAILHKQWEYIVTLDESYLESRLQVKPNKFREWQCPELVF